METQPVHKNFEEEGLPVVVRINIGRHSEAFRGKRDRYSLGMVNIRNESRSLQMIFPRTIRYSRTQP